MKVLVSIPNTGPVHSSVMFAAIRIAMNGRHSVKILAPHLKPYVNNLHHLVNNFMENGYDFWLNIDHDNPPLKNPLDVVDLDLDICGLPTPVWHNSGEKPGERPFYYSAWDAVPEGYKEHTPHKGIQRVDAVGTGCVVIARRVFEHPKMRKAPFAREWNEDGTVALGNDMAFCARARECGFSVFADYDHPCEHYHSLGLGEAITAFGEIK
jgi:hypothetical protein